VSSLNGEVVKELNRFYIGGRWVEPAPGAKFADIVNPATEAAVGSVAMGTSADVDAAVAAARAAFPAWSATSVETRAALLGKVIALYKERIGELADAITTEMGAPAWLARERQAPAGLGQLHGALAALQSFPFVTERGSTQIVREAIGVAALITPWNWPLNQIAAKVAPALAAGCTVVLKPSEITPLDAELFAQILHDAGVPAGVFNMIFGDGAEIGGALARHRDVDMVSITGSTRAGIDVALKAAPTVKRVTQELGGKSPNIILDDADLKTAVTQSVLSCMINSGQTCIAPTRLLVPAHLHDQAVAIAAATANALTVGDPLSPDTKVGPVSNQRQYERVQKMIRRGVDEGATLAAGGLGRPLPLTRGFYARPTVFANARNDMSVAREEIFGPVVVVIAYASEEDAIEIANDTDYGLAAYVSSADPARARRVGGQLRAGAVMLNGASLDLNAPFGGYKTSGNGREFGEHGISEFLETKSIAGCR
jgi:aldehyde dehydrogenase (NAD+)